MVLLFSRAKAHFDAPAPEGVGKASSVRDGPKAGIAVSALKAFVEQDKTVVPVEHQIAGGNTAGPLGLCWQCV